MPVRHSVQETEWDCGFTVLGLTSISGQLMSSKSTWLLGFTKTRWFCPFTRYTLWLHQTFIAMEKLCWFIKGRFMWTTKQYIFLLWFSHTPILLLGTVLYERGNLWFFHILIWYLRYQIRCISFLVIWHAYWHTSSSNKIHIRYFLKKKYELHQIFFSKSMRSIT